MIAYRAMLDVPKELVAYVSRLLGRRAAGTGHPPTCQGVDLLEAGAVRAGVAAQARGPDDPGRQLRHLRATAYRYRDEALGVLAARAPELSDALRRVAGEG